MPYHAPVSGGVVTCLNCGQPAGPRYCGNCGQSLADHRNSLAPLLHELVSEWTSIDGRVLRTAAALVHPGRLTQLYLAGKRVSFLTPLKLYLVASLALFSSVLTLDTPNANEVNLFVAGEPVTGPPVSGRPTITILQPRDQTTRWLLSQFADKWAELRKRPPQELVTRLFDQLRRVLPGALILFVPILALALKLFYLRRRVLYVDHLVVAVHFQSALFLTLAAMWLIMQVSSGSFLARVVAYVIVFLVMLTVYLSKALRRIYGERRAIAWLKTAALVFAYMFLLQQVGGAAMMLVLWRL